MQIIEDEETRDKEKENFTQNHNMIKLDCFKLCYFLNYDILII